MKTPNIPVRLLAAILVCAATQLSAEAGIPTIEQVASFGPPAFYNNLYALKINSAGDIAGYILEIPDGAAQGFVRPQTAPTS